MTAVTFPSSPNTNDVFTASNGSAYLWDGSRWINTGTLDQVVKRDGTEVSLAHSGDDLNINGDTFFVDASTNRISVGHTTPLTALDISGDITVSGTVDSRDIATDGTKLDGIEAAADVTDSTNVVAALTAGSNITIAADGTISSTSVAPTAAEILTAISTVDGVASGLDADLLDGQHGAYYLDYTNLTNVPGGGGTIDADTLDGIQASSFLRSGADDTFTGNLTTGADNHITFGPNSTWSSYLRVGGNGRTATGTEMASVVTTDGNLHLDSAASTNAVYLNFYAGTGGTLFGSGASSVVARMDNAGQLYKSTGTTNPYWNSTNDGAGSGLDADLLDGQQGSYYNQSQFTGSSFISRNSGNVVAVDNATTNTIGYTNSSSAAGFADGGIFSAAYSTAWVGQIFSNFRDGHIAVRGKNSGTWQSWHKVWDVGNDGSGSGLDADTVDGIQGATILRSGVTNNLNITNKGYYTTGTSGQNQNSGTISYGWGYQTSGAWSHPYPDLIFGYHTGMRFGGHTNYGGCRFYADHPSRSSAILLSVGNGNSNVHVNNSLSAGGNITAYSSDRRLKENFKNIESPLEKISKLNGCTFDWIENIEELGFTPDFAHNDIGLIAQEVEAVYPQAVAPAPFDHHVDISAEDPKDRIYKSISGQSFLTVKYEKLVPLLVEAIKELKAEIDILKNQEVI